MEKPIDRIQNQVVSAVGQVNTLINDLFSGNPLTTEMGKLIVRATDANVATTEEWALYLHICDIIVADQNAAADAVRAIRRQIGENITKSPQTIVYTLTLLETCMKNCGADFASLVCKNEFLDDLVKLAKKETPQVQEKVLSLIQSWADAFRNIPKCADIGPYYDDLKNRGVEFPPVDLDSMAPIITPKRTVYNAVAPLPVLPVPGAQPGIYVTTSHQRVLTDDSSIAKVQGELAVTRNHAEAFLKLTKQLPALSSITDPTLRAKLENLYNTSKEMRDRTAVLAQQVFDNQAVVNEILDVNDLLTNAINVYDIYSRPPPKPAVNPGDASTSADFDQADVGLSVAAFNKTDPIDERVAPVAAEKADNGEEKQSNDGL